MGADIVVGEGQSIGVGLSFGGPYVGLFACREKYVRQMPGRLCGETVDADGKRGFVLTLSTREQHIRREKATSNICTNSGLCALAFTDPHDAAGREGPARSWPSSTTPRAVDAADALASVPGVEVVNGAFFNEFTLASPKPARPVVRDAGATRASSPACRSAGSIRARRARERAGRRRHRDDHRRKMSPLWRPRSRRRWHDASISRGWRPEAPVAGGARCRAHLHRQQGADARRAAALRDRRRATRTGVDLPDAPKVKQPPRRPRAPEQPIGLPGLTEPETVRHYTRLSRAELRDRPRPVPARLVHDEAQSAPQREDGAAAGLRRHPPAAAAVDRAGRAGADPRARRTG